MRTVAMAMRIAFLVEQFKGSGLVDPSARTHGIDLKAMATKSVEQYAKYKAQKKTVGSLDIAKLPGVNHPVFKDKPVNYDPREVFIAKLFEERGESNIFHQFYRTLVQQLYDAGVSRNVYCVNIDAVIAALLLRCFGSRCRPERSAKANLNRRLHDLPVSAHAGLRGRDR
jgi:hypothetical protein